MAKKSLFLIQVATTAGEKIGAIEPAAFLASVKAPRGMFLTDVVEKFNAHKEKLGEPERVSIVLRKNVK